MVPTRTITLPFILMHSSFTATMLMAAARCNKGLVLGLIHFWQLL